MGKRNRRNNSGKQNKAIAVNPGEAEAICMPTPEFLARHQVEKVKTDQGNSTLRIRGGERPIDKYYDIYCKDVDNGIDEIYRRGITEEQFRAADRLARNYQNGFAKTVVPLDAIRVQTSINIGMYPVESIAHAIHQHLRVMKELSEISQEIIEHICCEEKNLIDYERKKEWRRKGYGMIRLREALDELIKGYKSIAKRSKG